MRALGYLALAFIVGACAQREETKTVAYYKAHPDERRVQLAECRNNPGERRATPNCINAVEADRQNSFGGAELKFQ